MVGVAFDGVRSWTVTLCLCASALVAAPATAETLNFFNWEAYIAPALVERWEAETGVKINQIFYDNGDERDEILSNPENDIDVVVVGELEARRFGKKGVTAPLPASEPAVTEIGGRWQRSCGDSAVPYIWGTLGIVYRADRITTPPQSWFDLLRPSPALAKRIAMLDDPGDLLTPALISIDKPVTTGDKTDLKEAFEVLKAQAPSVRVYGYIVSETQSPEYGDELDMALGYSGDQRALNEARTAGKPWRYVVPKEGTVLWVDCLAAVAKSPRLELAKRFIAFLNEPRNAAENSIALEMPTANDAAVPLLPEEMRKDPEVFPPDSVLAASQFYDEIPADVAQTRRRIAGALANIHDAQ